MAKVGILYICTGKYTVFWPDFYRTFREKFLPESDKTFFVFTDAPSIEGDGAPDVRRIYQKALDWPYSSLLRFKMFARQAEALGKMDYLFFANANLVCRETVTEAEFLPRPDRGERLLVVQQPGFWDKKPIFYTYDRNPKCRAYIPYNCGRDYVSGGLNGGTAAAFLAMSRELDRRTGLYHLDDSSQAAVQAFFNVSASEEQSPSSSAPYPSTSVPEGQEEESAM